MKILTYLLCAMMVCSQLAFGMQALAKKQEKVATESLASAQKKQEKTKQPLSPQEEFFEDHKETFRAFIIESIALQEATYNVDIDAYTRQEEKISKIFRSMVSDLMPEILGAAYYESFYHQVAYPIIDAKIRKECMQAGAITKDALMSKIDDIKVHIGLYDYMIKEIPEEEQKTFKNYAIDYAKDLLGSVVRVAGEAGILDAQLQEKTLIDMNELEEIGNIIQFYQDMKRHAYTADDWTNEQDRLGIWYKDFAQRIGMSDVRQYPLLKKMEKGVIEGYIDDVLQRGDYEKPVLTRIESIKSHIKNYDAEVATKIPSAFSQEKETYKKYAIAYANALLDGLVRLAEKNKDPQLAAIKKAATHLVYTPGSFPVQVDTLAKPIDQASPADIMALSEKGMAALYGFSPDMQKLFTLWGYEFLEDITRNAAKYQKEIKEKKSEREQHVDQVEKAFRLWKTKKLDYKAAWKKWKQFIGSVDRVIQDLPV